MEYRDATEADDDRLIEHYLAVWRSYGVPEVSIVPAANEIVRSFLQQSREVFEGGAIVALEAHQVVGSLGYQVQTPQFPEVLRPEVRKMGYIWSVFVVPEQRSHGVASRMVALALDRLRAIGCSDAVLHASDAGAPVYERLGFTYAKEMRLKLKTAAS